MIRSSGNTIVDVVKCRWSQRGSKQRLIDFLRVVDPWLEAVTVLCAQLDVAIVDFSASDQEQTAFLGARANGRVFKLTNGAVLKVVVGRKSDDVLEYQKLLYSRTRFAAVWLAVWRSQDIC